jgi:hypothetical protein
MSKNNIPVYNLNMPNGGIQKPVTDFTNNTPVYSSYTGNLVSNGPIKVGTLSDAPVGHKNFGTPFHVIERVELPGSKSVFMAHDYSKTK